MEAPTRRTLGLSKMIGPCHLCKVVTTLQRSHVLPAGFYRRMLDHGAKNPNPVLLTHGSAVQSSKQVTAPILCGSCEQRFNQGGERWVLAHCFDGKGKFLLREATGIAALPESQIYQSFLLIASNQALDPNSLLVVGYRYSAMVYGVWVPDLADESVDPGAAKSDGGWQDPLTGFHNGADSWYFGNLFGFDVGHLVDSTVTNSGDIPINAHIDPFGPFNPFHYIIQLPSMLFPGGQPGAATCAVVGGCSIN